MFPCIFEYMMLMLHKLRRNKLHRVVGIMRKNIISTREILVQHFFRNGMFINDRFQILQIRLTFSFSLRPFAYGLRRIRFDLLRIG